MPVLLLSCIDVGSYKLVYQLKHLMCDTQNLNIHVLDTLLFSVLMQRNGNATDKSLKCRDR